MGINVRNAYYGSPNIGLDITKECVGIVSNGETQIVVLPDKLGIPDPDFNVSKGFIIEYIVDGITKIKGGIDGDTIQLN